MENNHHSRIFRTLLVTLLMAATALPAGAYDFMVDSIAYSINEDGETVTVVKNGQDSEDVQYGPTYSGDVVVPETVNNAGKDYTVVAIGRRAFIQCRNLKSITLPCTLQQIDYEAFCSCSGLLAVSIPNSVKVIGRGAFMDCSGLKSITLPDSLEDLNNYIFMGCIKLDSIQLPVALKHIYSCAFDGCASIKEIVIPDSVERINSFAFRGCSNLEEITLGESLQFIDDEAFTTSCSNLHTVKWSVIDYGDFNSRDDNPFYLLNLLHGNITSFEFGEKVTRIPNYICSQFTNLESIAIPKSVKTIGVEAFVLCNNVSSVRIPQSVEMIGDNAFAECEGVTSIITDIKEPQSITCSSSAFDGIDKSSCTLYVPKGSLIDYQTTAPWNEFLNIAELEKGDVNCDGTVNSADVTAIYDIMLGVDSRMTCDGDVDGDGTVTAADIMVVYNILLGNQ